MNPLEEDIAKLFAVNEPGVHDEAFRAAVRQRIETHRFARTALALGVVAVGVAGMVAVAVLVPAAVLYPVALVTKALSSPLGAGAAVVGAMGVTWWTTFVEG
jgi:UDP-N-acetylmuramyl pentapeptide synthase